MSETALAQEPDVEIHLAALLPWQRDVNANLHRFNVLACGRRAGKTQFGEYLQALRIIAGEPVAWFSPSYLNLGHTYRNLYAGLEQMISHAIRNERIEVSTGGCIDFWSLSDENAAKLSRGRAYTQLIVDEAAYVRHLRELNQAVLRPMLSDYQGSALYLSSPAGFNEFHQLYAWGQDTARADWASWQIPTWSNPVIPAHEIDAARQDLDPRIFAQEYGASFEYFSGRVYLNFTRANIADVQDDGRSPLEIGMDFNVDPMSAVIAQRRADQLHVFDEVELMGSNTPEMIQEIQRRYPNRKVSVYPDPSGRSRKTSAAVGITDFVLLQRAGFTVRAPLAAPMIVDRINETNALACNAQGQRRLLVSPRCKRLIQCLEQLPYKEGTSVVDKSLGLDHLTDGLGYLIHVLFPIRRGVTKSRVVYG